MKAVIQRVTRAAIHIEGKTVGQIESGLLILLGVAKGDGETDGRRPSFDEATPPDEAIRLYEQIVAELQDHGTHLETGIFAAHMQVELLNDGPVTFVLDSRDAYLAGGRS